MTNVVFVYGSLDPCVEHRTIFSTNACIYINGKLNILQISLIICINSSINYLIYLKDCADMYPPSDCNMPQLKEAKN